MVKYTCENCGSRLETDGERGTHEDCPVCGYATVVPQPTPSIFSRIRGRWAAAKQARAVADAQACAANQEWLRRAEAEAQARAAAEEERQRHPSAEDQARAALAMVAQGRIRAIVLAGVAVAALVLGALFTYALDGTRRWRLELEATDKELSELIASAEERTRQAAEDMFAPPLEVEIRKLRRAVEAANANHKR